MRWLVETDVSMHSYRRHLVPLVSCVFSQETAAVIRTKWPSNSRASTSVNIFFSFFRNFFGKEGKEGKRQG